MKQFYVEIHKALHDPSIKKVTVNGVDYKISEKGANKLRYVIITDEGRQWEVIQQNDRTSSSYGARARGGEKLSWKIPVEHGVRLQTSTNPWQLIKDDTKVE